MFSRRITSFLLVVAALPGSVGAQQAGDEPGAAPAVPPVIPATPLIPAPAPADPAAVPAPTTPSAPEPGAPMKAPTIQDPPSTSTGEFAKLPYRELIRIAQSDARQPETSETFTLKISSRLGIPSGQIELYLETKEGPRTLEVDQHGFFQVPFNWQLAEEDPLLITNQPKGSLNLQVDLSLPVVASPKLVDGKVKYRDLFAPVLELNQSMREVDPEFGQPDRQQFAFEIDPGEGKSVKIQRPFGSRTLKPDENGSVWLVFEKLLYEEQAEILMPNSAEVSIRPVTAEQALAIRAQ